VVDDTSENIDLLVEILEEDYEVKVAINGDKALKIARSAYKPDLILLDIMMPDMNGYTVCQLLKSDLTTKSSRPYKCK
jgi:putative two-component system response regulator